MSDAGAPGTPDEGRLTFTLDGREVQARKGDLLIAAAERAGTFIPRFCYHPRMASVGVCRMCLVEVSGPRGPSLQPSCFIEVQDGMTVDTTSARVKKAQDGVLEFLLINHPLDCPVCDKGGECPLQDQTLAYGPGESRFVEEKRHFAKPIPISELVLLDRERCIQCSRCVRFADEIAGEAQIDFIGRGEQLEIGIFPELPFTSYFSGNTVQICPVGALTATPYRFAARPWDLDQVESTCTTCAVGCRVAVQSSSNRVTRLLGIDSDPVNQGWLCDKGRFASDAVNSEERLVEPLVRKAGELVPASWHEALQVVADRLREALDGSGAGGVGVLGGARLTNEGAYAWTKLAKGVLRTDSVDAQLGDGLPAEIVAALPRATIDEMATASTVLVLSGDLREELPVLFLRLRGAVTGDKTSLVEIAPRATSLTSCAAASLRVRPGEVLTAAAALAGDAEPPDSIGRDELAEVRRLLAADRLVVVLGRPSLAEAGELVAEAAQVLHRGFPNARFLPALRRGNVQGAIDMGMAPGMLPGRVSLEGGRRWFEHAWGGLPDARGRDTTAILQSAAGDARETGGGAPIGALVLLGADPLHDFPDADLAARALEGAGFVVAVASAPDAVTERADVVLPAAEAHERPGTTTNLEGRISRLGQKLVPPGQAWPDWMIAAELAVHLGADLGFDSAAAVWDEIEHLAPSHLGITRTVLDEPGAADGVVAPLVRQEVTLVRRPVAPLDPIAFPGVESVEWQGAPPRAGLAETPDTVSLLTGEGSDWDGGNESGNENADAAGSTAQAAEAADRDAEPRRPECLRAPVDLDVPRVPAAEPGSLRLVASRHLYDLGSSVRAVPELAALVPTARVRVHPEDLDALGVPSASRVRVRTTRGAAVVEVAPDPSLARGVAATEFNVPFAAGDDSSDATPEGPTVADLIDAAEPVVELALEAP
jgi:NADH-quinone oxidoreductase subunit G